MSVRPRYDIAVEPCVPVRIAGGHELLGLEDVLVRAHEIEDLAVPVPPAASGLLRIGTVIAARVTGLDDPELSAGEWAARRRDLLTAGGGFEPAAVRAYFAAHVWDLFHPTRPWLQDPALAGQCRERAGVNSLVFGRPAGNNLAWLSRHTDTDPLPVPCEEALIHLLVQHFYGPAGTCSTRTVNGRGSSKGTAGPLRATISFHPLGRTLFETLLAGLPPYLGEEQQTVDACPWEEAAPPDPLGPLESLTWPGRLLTGRSRRAVLLVPTPDGRAVADAYLTWGTQQPRLEATDPYLIYDINPKKAIEKRRAPRRAEAERAWWRDLDALLLAGDETARVKRPLAFGTLNDLPPSLRSALRVRVHAFDQDSKTIDRLWYTALTPPVFPFSQEHDPERAAHIAACRRAAEQIGAELATQARLVWQAATTPAKETATAPRRSRRRCAWESRALAVYWREAETAFWRLLQGPTSVEPRPVFASRAVAALRKVTAPALARHRRVAPALARAVATLLANPTTPRRGRTHPGEEAA
jgi:CRISPR system Cascade subunit CasA